MKLYILSTILIASAAAAPFLELSISNKDKLAKPFSNATVALSQNPISGWSLFRRQGSCPLNTLVCPSGKCCSYDSSCCGNNCCPAGYLCTGGTATSPCCVAIGSSSNNCGSSNSNPCSTPGYLPCTNVNLCCPPNSQCYYDTNNVGRCAPLPSPSPSPSPRLTTTPIPTPRYTTPSTTTPIPTPHYTTPSTTTPLPTPRFSTTTPAPVPQSPVTTPIPPPNFTPIPSPNGSSSSFWTPAAIGGVAGGGTAFLIIVVLLVCCCLRKRNGRYVYRFGPLSDGQIYALVMNLETTQGWQEFYINEAKRLKGHAIPDQSAWFEDFAARAVSQRIIQLKNGGGYTLTTIFSAAVSAIPLAKVWAIPWSSRRFNDVAIEALGLGDTADVNRLAKEAASKTDRPTTLGEKIAGLSQTAAQKLIEHEWMHSALREHLKDEIKQYLTHELGAEAAMHLVDELVHVKTGLGTVYSMTRGTYKSTQQKDTALEYLRGAAMAVHLRVFVVNALAETFPEDFALKIEK